MIVAGFLHLSFPRNRYLNDYIDPGAVRFPRNFTMMKRLFCLGIRNSTEPLVFLRDV